MEEELRTKKVEYTKHEYLKMSEVGALISEASQSVLNKINQKDKTTQENKQQLRKQDGKIYMMEQQIGTLLQLTHTVKDQFKKIKDLN